jgi:NADH:ubiquinone oxidoreductase subunit C
MSERIEIPAEKLHEEMLKLRQGKHMDFLRSLTGMDWGEEGLGVVYHLEDTNTRENIVVSTRTTNREKPELPSVSDIWKGAEFNEREVYDYYGIRFIGHPDMRRLFLRDDWVGYPLRKDYDESLNPLRMTNEEPVDTTQYIEVQHDGSVIEKRETIFDEDEYIINIGPQHPATHGVLRFRVSLEGEIIKKLDVHCGYIHRGIEKMCESLKKEVFFFKSKNSALLTNETVFAVEKKKYLESIVNVIKRTIENERLKVSFYDRLKSNNFKISDEVARICEKIAQENNIPDSAFVEIFKDSNKTAYIFNLLTVRKYTVNQNEDIKEYVKNKRLGR